MHSRCRRCSCCLGIVVCGLAVLAAVVVLLVPVFPVALLSRVPMVPRSMGILVLVVVTFVVTYDGLVSVRTALCAVLRAGRWFRSQGKFLWTRTRCLCPFLHLCCLWRFLASGLLGRRLRVTMGSLFLSRIVLLSGICIAFVMWAAGIPFLFLFVAGGMHLHEHRCILGVCASWWLLVVRCDGC